MIKLDVAETNMLEGIGRNVKAARISRGLSQSSLAFKAGISRQTIVRLEAGDTGISLGIFVRIFNIFGMLELFEPLASPKNDELGMALNLKNMPKRVYRKKIQDEDLDF